MNYAITDEYKKYYKNKKADILLNCKTIEKTIINLEFDYCVEVSQLIKTDSETGLKTKEGSTAKLVKDGKEVLEWFSAYPSGLYYLFEHSDGKKYFIYKKDLYGYSVLCLDTMDNVDYIPQCTSGYFTNVDFEETFIWCSAVYNKFNNKLAVEGCFWAYPYSVIILNFTEPLKYVCNENWKTVNELFSMSYEHCIEISDFSEDKIVLSVERYSDEEIIHEQFDFPLR